MDFGGRGWWGELGHGFLEQVAVFGDLPLVVGLDQHAGRQAQQRGRAGEDPDDIGSTFDFPVQPLQRIGRPDLAPMGLKEVGERGDLLACVSRHRCYNWLLRLQHQRDGLDLGPDQRPGGLGEDGPDRGSDHLALALGDPGHHVAQQPPDRVGGVVHRPAQVQTDLALGELVGDRSRIRQ